MSGFKVFPNEVEDVVTLHPGVLEAAAIGVPDERTGQAVKLFVVRRDPALTRSGAASALPRQSDRLQNSKATSNSASSCRRAISGKFSVKNCTEALRQASGPGGGMLTLRRVQEDGRITGQCPSCSFRLRRGLYDRMQPLYTGEVKPEGIDLNFIAIDQPRPIFDRMSGGQEFDVCGIFAPPNSHSVSPATSARSWPSRCSRRLPSAWASSPSTRSPASRRPRTSKASASAFRSTR